MKRIFVAVALMLTVAGVCIFKTLYLNESVTTATNYLEVAERELSASNLENTERILALLEKHWHSRTRVLRHLISSEQIFAAEMEICTLREKINVNNAYFYIAKRRLEVILDDILAEEGYAIL